MCECGCIGTDVYYTLAGPGASIYLVTLSRACKECDAPDAVTIEQFASRKDLKSWCCGELPPSLPLKHWNHSNGVAILTGRRHDEFIKAQLSNLIGVVSDDLTDKPSEGLDSTAAEVILDEMYPDSIFQPTLASSAT